MTTSTKRDAFSWAAYIAAAVAFNVFWGADQAGLLGTALAAVAVIGGTKLAANLLFPEDPKFPPKTD
jgi:hypothetical protein